MENEKLQIVSRYSEDDKKFMLDLLNILKELDKDYTVKQICYILSIMRNPIIQIPNNISYEEVKGE